MKIWICSGKGGVGKTNCAVALALYLSRMGKRTGIIDYDGGHSVKNTLGVTKTLTPNTVHRVVLNLSVAIVENTDYIGIVESKAKGQHLSEYLAQFPRDFGLIPLADMVNAFFGVPTDIATLQKFTALVTILKTLETSGYEDVIIDVEPTAGLERLLSNARSTVRSLLNLKKQGVVSLALIGAKWPDIAGFIKGGYIEDVEHYCGNIERAVELITTATYLIVATPEASPIAQTFEVRRIIEKFGGRVSGYIINNLRGEPHEQANIARLESESLPIVRIPRWPELHDPLNCKCISILLGIGQAIAIGI